MSVDGFAAGPSGEQVIFEAVGEEVDLACQRWNESLLDGVDEVLLGRTSYQSFVQFWPDAEVPIADRVNSMGWSRSTRRPGPAPSTPATGSHGLRTSSGDPTCLSAVA